MNLTQCMEFLSKRGLKMVQADDFYDPKMAQLSQLKRHLGIFFFAVF